MTRKDAAAPAHVRPGIRIHAIDIVQPPGMRIPIADMDPPHTIVTAALAAKSSAEVARKAPWDASTETRAVDRGGRSRVSTAILVMAASGRIAPASGVRASGPLRTRGDEATLRPLLALLGRQRGHRRSRHGRLVAAPSPGSNLMPARGGGE